MMTHSDHTPRPRPPRLRAAFSLIELVIVVVIIGIVAAIAVPRMTSASERSKTGALQADLRVVTVAIDFYTAEHADLSPAHEKDGSVITDPTLFIRRLLQRTNIDGDTAGPGNFGPYLRNFPANPFNHKQTVRINGAPAGANTHGWRFDTGRSEFQADDSVESAAIRPGGISVSGGGKVDVELGAGDAVLEK
jgi:prepilin-type N-terminal cleavage/methylation domain-containing protein